MSVDDQSLLFRYVSIYTIAVDRLYISRSRTFFSKAAAGKLTVVNQEGSKTKVKPSRDFFSEQTNFRIGKPQGKS